MLTHLALVTIVVNDYDIAIDFYTKKLEFTLIEDTLLSPTKRWVVISPSKNTNCKLLLAKAKNEKEMEAVGNQTGGRVGFFLYTTNIKATYNSFQNNGVEFTETIRTEAYGKVVVFKDLYGNLWDLIEPIN